MKIFFIGDPMLVNGYRLSGVDVIQVTSPEEMAKALDHVYKMESSGIILVDRDYSSQVKEKVEQLRLKHAMPVLVEVPGRKGSADIDLKSTISRIMGVKM
jgi:vacuolar-type H+-ATPase subunit F/Vma7